MTDVITIQCGERLSIEMVEELFSRVEASLHNSADICLAGNNIQFCDTAGLQLILSLQKTLAKTGGSICWQGVSPVLTETAAYLGLTRVLNLSEYSQLTD